MVCYNVVLKNGGDEEEAWKHRFHLLYVLHSRGLRINTFSKNLIF